MKFETKEELGAYLVKANHKYREGNPIISDDEYDILENELRKVFPQHPILLDIDDCDFGLERKLTIHMGSQQKALNLEELQSWLLKNEKNELHWSLKLDGMSAELTYENGSFIQMLSRGNGFTGSDYTQVAFQIDSIPRKINALGTTVVRGELILTKENLIKVNELLKAEGRDQIKNERNGAVGIVKSLERNLHLAKYLSFKAFDIIEDI